LLPGVIELGCGLLLDGEDNGVRAADGLKSVLHLEDVVVIGCGAAMPPVALPDKEAGYLGIISEASWLPTKQGLRLARWTLLGGCLILAVAAAWG
jgi:hypothetical protein